MGIFEVLWGVVAALAGGVVTFFANRDPKDAIAKVLKAQLEDANGKLTSLRAENDQLRSQAQVSGGRIAVLEADAARYQRIQAELSKSRVISTYYQPVVLVGPREVGKTSLLAQWHAPWDRTRYSRTATPDRRDVPVFNFLAPDRIPHFAVPDVMVEHEIQLSLAVYDYPGEATMQTAIRKALVEQTAEVHRASKKNLGVVLICMFDAEEAKTGISIGTRQYYNGELFSGLRDLVVFKEVEIERLIFIFNKYDRLRHRYPAEPDDATLLRLCISQFNDAFGPLRSFCNADKVCELFTILNRDNMQLENRGAPIAMGEAARGLVHAFAGREAGRLATPQEATTFSADLFTR